MTAISLARARWQLLSSGAADLIIVPAHEAECYESAGAATVLAELIEPDSTKDLLGTLCPTSTIFIADDRIDERPDFAQHLATAFARTLTYVTTHSVDEQVDLVPDAVIAKPGDLPATGRSCHRHVRRGRHDAGRWRRPRVPGSAGAACVLPRRPALRRPHR